MACEIIYHKHSAFNESVQQNKHFHSLKKITKNMCTGLLQTLKPLKLKISTYENKLINSSGWPETDAHNGNTT